MRTTKRDDTHTHTHKCLQSGEKQQHNISLKRRVILFIRLNQNIQSSGQMQPKHKTSVPACCFPSCTANKKKATKTNPYCTQGREKVQTFGMHMKQKTKKLKV